MIYEVEGDILMSRADVIAQGVSVNDPMNKWPRQKTAGEIPKCGDQFIEWCTDTNPEPGDIWLWRGNTKTKVLNLIIGEAVDPELVCASRLNKIAVQRAFRAVNKRVAKQRLSSIAMPKIGSGAGGID